jgi:hypothetical protein
VKKSFYNLTLATKELRHFSPILQAWRLCGSMPPEAIIDGVNAD